MRPREQLRASASGSFKTKGERASAREREGETERERQREREDLASDLPLRMLETLIEPRLESDPSANASEALLLQYDMIRSCWLVM